MGYSQLLPFSFPSFFSSVPSNNYLGALNCGLETLAPSDSLQLVFLSQGRSSSVESCVLGGHGVILALSQDTL